MVSAPRRLRFGHAQPVEEKSPARPEQLRPTEQVKPGATVLGLCHACKSIVYAGDELAMAGVCLFHEDCAPPAAGAT